MGHQHQALDVLPRHRLEPYRLPDARLGGVPDLAAVEHLLPAGVRGGLGEVAHPHLEEVLPVAEGIGDIEGERQVAAGVPANLGAVDPDHAALVDSAEVKKDAIAVRPVEAAAVPEPLLRLQLPTHAGELGLRRERHHDRGPGLRAPVVGGERVLPRAVEVHPTLADELGTGMLGQRQLGVDLVTPPGQHARLPRHSCVSTSSRRSSMIFESFLAS